MKPHFGYLMVCTKMWHIHFLSRRTLGLAPFPAAPWLSTEISFLVVLNHFLRDLFSQAEESSQARAGP